MESEQAIVAVLCSMGQCRSKPPPLVLFAGGMENWTSLVARLYDAVLDGSLRVLGPNAEQLRSVRSPKAWCSAAEGAGANFPLTRMGDAEFGKEPDDALDSRKWLIKPYDGAGGIGVASCSTDSHRAPPSGYYYQRHAAGRVLGAHFVCRPQPRLLGVTESFGAEDWPAPGEFTYRGSWGPLSTEELNQPTELNATGGDAEPRKPIVSVEQRLIAMAASLQQQSDLLGWLQLDVILDSGGELWLLDVNPRWSAGMELLVDSGTCNPVVEHLRAFGVEFPPQLPTTIAPAKSRSAKAVVYANQAFTWSLEQLQRLQSRNGIADIPPATLVGQPVEIGEPLVTVKSSLPAELDYANAKRMLLTQLQFLQAELFAELG